MTEYLEAKLRNLIYEETGFNEQKSLAIAEKIVALLRLLGVLKQNGFDKTQ